MSDVLKHMNDQIKPEPPIYVERKYCPDCKCYVQAQLTLFDPDNIDDGFIWECLQCGNAIEYLED